MAWRTTPLPPNWQSDIRPRILTRDPRCQLRTHCWSAPSTEVDHIGDPNDHTDNNLRGVCTTCHGHRTGQQGNAAMQAKRPTARRTPPRHPGIL
jgi:5-methylcytosine-specific restriction protein A